MSLSHRLLKKITVVFILVILNVTIVNNAVAAFFPLEITNIKPAGSGCPEISQSNRIFRAYPGIDYNIRPAVIGGVYPYSYWLENEPDGMQINHKTGEILWKNPQKDAKLITLVVTDSEKTSVKTTWSIDVSDSFFYFVDSSYTGKELGTFSNPFSSLQSMLNNTKNKFVNNTVYFRGGNYKWVEFNADNNEMNLNYSPRQWIAFPGEIVTIDADSVRLRLWTGNSLYFDGFVVSNMLDHGFVIGGGSSYTTIRRSHFSGIRSSSSVNNNQGIIYATEGGFPGGYGLTIQDCIFTEFVGTQAVGSLYSGHKILIENNFIFNGGYPGKHSFCTPIGIKAKCSRYTIRGNKIIMPSNATSFEIYNPKSLSDDAEICFNLIIKDHSNDISALLFFYPKNIYIYNNTIIGDVKFLPKLSNGPYYFFNNIHIGKLIDDINVVKYDNISSYSYNNMKYDEDFVELLQEKYGSNFGLDLIQIK